MSACNIEGNVIYYKKPIPFGYIGIIQGIREKVMVLYLFKWIGSTIKCD